MPQWTSEGSRNKKKLLRILKKFVPEDSARTFADASYRRNCALPVSRIPEHLIARIIQLASNPAEEDSFDSRQVLSYAHVCRQWRKAASAAPQLWSQISIQDSASVGYQHILRIFLERCLSSPLQAEIRFPKQSLESTVYWPFLKSKADQVVSLSLHVDGGTEMNVLEIIKQPAPALQKLSVNVWSLQSNSLDYKAGIAIRSQLFHYQAPSLHTLHLCQIAPPAASPLFSGLTRLHVENANTYDQEFNAEDLLNILRRCPDLEELELMNSGPRLQADSEGRLRHTPRVRLRSLHKLLLVSGSLWVDDSNNILQYIIAPVLLNVTLSQAGNLQLFRALPTGLKPQVSIDTLRIPCPMNSAGMEFELYNSRSGSLEYPVFAFCQEAELPPFNDIDTEFSDFVGNWSLKWLERLDVVTLMDCKTPDEFFTKFMFLKHFPSLKIISFSGKQDNTGPEHVYIADFIDNLEGLRENDDDLQETEFEEPEELMFDSISFTDPAHAGRRHVSKALAKLKGYLWRRMDRGVPLPRLTLRRCPGVRASFAKKHLQPLVLELDFEVWVGLTEVRSADFLSPLPTSSLDESCTSLTFTYAGSNVSTGS